MTPPMPSKTDRDNREVPGIIWFILIMNGISIMLNSCAKNRHTDQIKALEARVTTLEHPGASK